MTADVLDRPAAAEAPAVACIDRAALLRAVRFCRCTLPARNEAVPLLDAVEISIEADRVKVRATDLHHELGAGFNAPFQPDITPIRVPARRLAGVLAAAADTEIQISVVGSVCKIAGADWSARIRGFGDELPVLATGGAEGFRADFAAGELQAVVASAVPFMSNEETRFYLNGGLFEIGADDQAPGSLRIVATNGHRIIVRDTVAAEITGSGVVKGIVPRFAAVAVTKLPQDTEVSVRLGRSAVERTGVARLGSGAPGSADSMTYAVFRARGADGSEWTVSTSLIDGTYPEYRRVIPKESNGAVDLNGPAFRRALQVVDAGNSTVPPCTSPINLIVHDHRLWLRSQSRSPADQKLEDDNRASVPLLSAADEGILAEPIGFNPRYLAECVKAVGAGPIRMSVSPEGISKITGPAPGTTVVLMPMRIHLTAAQWRKETGGAL